jgi:hypothetical protein
MDTKLKRSTTFHTQTCGKTKVVNMNLVQLLRGYNENHQKTWDENFISIKNSYNRSGEVRSTLCMKILH